MITWRDVFRAILHFSYGVCFVAFLVLSLSCVSDVIYRRGGKDWSEELSGADGGIYTAKYAYLGRGWILLRIYKTGEAEILAERTYLYGDKVKITWTQNSVVYDTAEASIFYNGSVSLPPTWLDRLLARLP